MLTGYNTDFKFQGSVYHCQTEDGGVNNPFITSLLYKQGAILASRKTSYEDILKADCLDEVVRELMMEQHKSMIRDLMQGKVVVGSNAPHEVSYTSAAAPKQEPKPEPEPKAELKPEPKPVPKPEPKKEEKPAAQAAPPPPPPPLPPPREEPREEPKEKSLDDIILDFLAQEQKERSKQK
jgi:hypothetical protein